jgi:hypothetical protein
MQARRSVRTLTVVALVALAPVGAFAADPPPKADPVRIAAADQPAASTRRATRASARYRAQKRQAVAARSRPCSFFSCPFQLILGIGY